MVALNGNPTQAGAAFAGVYAAALANGGSFANIAPGVAYFKQLKQAGNFVPVTGSASTMESGQTPILIWWDYLLASEVGAKYKNLKIVIPSDAHYAAYYDQAISKSAPAPGRRPAVGGVPVLRRGPEPVPRGRHPADRAAGADRRGHGGQDGLRRAAAGAARGHHASRPSPSRTRRRPSSPSSGRASRADQCLNRQYRYHGYGHGPGVPRGPRGWPRSVPAPGRAPPRRSARPRAAARYAGILPFTAYVVLGLIIPMIAVGGRRVPGPGHRRLDVPATSTPPPTAST